MTYRERFAATLRHEAVDRVPFDLAGTPMSSIEAPETVARLRALLGIEGAYTGKYAKFDERILEALDIDFRKVGDILEPHSPLARRISESAFTDCWGVKRVFTGLYWDIQDPPLKGATLEDLETYRWPRAEDVDPAVIQRYAQEARRLYEETDYVVVGEHPIYGVFELGCWMCGFDDFLLRVALEPEFVEAFFQKVFAYQRDIIALYYGAIGRYLHVTTSGDDFGMQTGPLLSPDMFAEQVAPFYRDRIRCTKEFTDGAFFHHSCGAIYPLIPQLIDAGVEILNPIQPGAKDMEPEKLKQAYGARLTFWGGIDTQHVLPEGDAESVKRHVRDVLEKASAHGGYVLAPAHNVQPDVPAENLLAIYAAGREYGA